MCNLSVPEANLQLRRNLATAAIESVQDLNLRLDLKSKLGAKCLVFFSSRSLKMREKYTSFAQLVLLSLYIF